MMPLTMMPVGAKGDNAPELAPLPTMMAIRKAGIPTRAAVDIAIGAMIAAVAMFPGPIEASAAGMTKYIDGDQAAIAAAGADRVPRHPVQRPVGLRERKQQRDADQREEEGRGKAANDRVGARQAGDVDADDPRHADRQHADVQLREAADDDEDAKRGNAECTKAHGGTHGSRGTGANATVR